MTNEHKWLERFADQIQEALDNLMEVIDDQGLAAEQEPAPVPPLSERGSYEQGHKDFEQECHLCPTMCKHITDHLFNLAGRAFTIRTSTSAVPHDDYALLIQDLHNFVRVLEVRWYG